MKGIRKLAIWLVAALAAVVLAACSQGPVEPGGTTSTLTINFAGDGAGTVTSEPAGINCAGDAACAADFVEGDEVTLTATAAAGSTFTAWGGDCAAATGNTCTVVMDDDATVSVTFSADDGGDGNGDGGGDGDTAAGRVAGMNDTAEELITSGTYGDGYTYVGSSDLELAYDPGHGTRQVVGVRFSDADIAADDVVDSAHIEFTAMDTPPTGTGGLGTLTLTIHGELAVDAPAFEDESVNGISGRTTTTASVTWTITEAWQGDTVYQTPDLSPIIAELQAQPGWDADSSIVFIFTSETGEYRRAYSVNNDGDAAQLETAPRLVVNTVN